jgi:hypothetical protein
MAVAITAAAIGIGHASSDGPTRVASPPAYQVLSAAVTGLHGDGTLALDTETGRLEPLALPRGMGLDSAGVSPWVENGQRQVVGIGWNRSGSGGSLQRSELGLVRLSLPDEVVLDHLTLSDGAPPVCPPCWIPGAEASVLYVGGDFRLYRVDFEGYRPDGGLDDGTGPRPRPLVWSASEPSAGDVRFKDVTWPDNPRLRGRLLASLRFDKGETGRTSDWEIWWLQLGTDGLSIVDAGRLLEPAPAAKPTVTRHPNLVRGADGTPALAYLTHSPGQSGYQLRVAPIRFDPDSHVPHSRDAESLVLAEDCPPAIPAVSPDGQWVTIVRPGGSDLKVERIAIPASAAPPRLASVLLDLTDESVR